MNSKVLFSSAVALFGLIRETMSTATNNTNSTMVTDFSQITPSHGLQWQPCYENYTCTRLLVPLDYGNSSAGTVPIAYIKSAAENENNNTHSILLNPGGPGGSGVELLLGSVSLFRQMVGPNYNLIGFDPRGVYNSGPSTDCFLGDRKLSANARNTVYLNSVAVSEEYRNAKFELANGLSDLCANRLDDASRYIGTTAVAQDMLTFTEKQWEAKGHDPKEAKLYYMGFSYGTALGATFATLFPDRIGRLVIDGVVNSLEYYQGEWAESLTDTDAAIESFFDYCSAAGPTLCAFYNSTSDAIKKRYRLLADRLSVDPILVVDPNVVEIPVYADISQMRLAHFNAAYEPIDAFPILAQVLADLEMRNGSSLLAVNGMVPCYNCDVSKLGWQGDFAGLAIAGVDSAGRGEVETLAEWTDIVTNYLSSSEYAGDQVAILRISGNWGQSSPASREFNGKIGAKTNVPLLVLSNKFDPATPLKSARTIAPLFPGSRVLVNNAVGHTTANAPSDCIFKYVREYFDDGTLPPANTTCEPNTKPFLSAM